MNPQIDVLYGPPGTGKTTELLHRMAVVTTRGVPPSKIGFLAFTKAAAGEALKRLSLRQSRTIRTIHSLAYEVSGCSREQVVDRDKLQELAEITGYPITGKNSRDGGSLEMGDELLELCQLSAATKSSIEHTCIRARSHHDPSVAAMFQTSYELWKKAFGYRDFNDMLLAAARTDFDLGLEHLFVDEGQDLSPLQWDIVARIMEKTPHVTLAGDDDQAIFTWAGADPHGMRKFAATRTEVLGQSHRIPAAVHRLAEDVIGRIRDRVPKTYLPRREEGSVRSRLDLGYLDPPMREDTLVLYRNHSARPEVEQWLIRNRVAYHSTDGLSSWYEDRFANAVRAYFRLKAGEEVNRTQWECLRKVAREDLAAAMGQKQDIRPWIDRNPWNNLIRMPWEHEQYLLDLGQLDGPPNCRISTIHSAKGAQADRVILMNSRGERTMEESDDNEHRVWYVAVTRAKHQLDIVQGDNPYELQV